VLRVVLEQQGLLRRGANQHVVPVVGFCKADNNRVLPQ
jgi:hypothetical protein